MRIRRRLIQISDLRTDSIWKRSHTVLARHASGYVRTHVRLAEQGTHILDKSMQGGFQGRGETSLLRISIALHDQQVDHVGWERGSIMPYAAMKMRLVSGQRCV